VDVLNDSVDLPSPGVTAAAGFRASGVVAGLKGSGRPDLALVVNDGPSQAAAAVFTTNRVVGAPVVWSRQAVADGVVSAVVLNSGGANVCTGPGGFQDTHATAEKVGAALASGCPSTRCSPASTSRWRRSRPTGARTPRSRS
jgi:glutamate N-acetyltransferase/amino-acid N-acetyltransferase